LEWPAGASISSASAANTLGTVEAASEKEAIEKAAERFEIPPERRNRIAVQKISKNRD
jgi:hypothetical protein